MQQYTYDGQNQLTTVKDASGNTLYAYTYDTVGNIRSKTDGSVTHTYTYGNTQWADQLTAFDGHAITYDGAGNPLTYYNGAEYTLTWSRGRQLATATIGTTTVSYTYDMAGVRNSKTVGGVTYEFTTLSGKLMRQTWQGNELQFVYDASNRPYMMVYTPANGNTQNYYYVLNVQGDVVGLLNASGSMVAHYTYDPWGKPTGTTASNAYATIAEANPLRYRGYYYDSETGFYYLQSRYYDPAISRFINADSYITTDITGLLSGNMFAYCENNPVMCSDPDGHIVRTYNVMVDDSGTADIIEAVASKKPGGVKGTGIALSGGWGIAGTASAFYVEDTYGNKGILITAGAGGGLGFSARMQTGNDNSSATVLYFKDADTIYDLAGYGVSIGTTIEIFSGELSSIINGKMGYTYGVGKSRGYEFHCVIAYSCIIPVDDWWSV